MCSIAEVTYRFHLWNFSEIFKWQESSACPHPSISTTISCVGDIHTEIKQEHCILVPINAQLSVCLHDINNDEDKTIAILPVFSKNCWANKRPMKIWITFPIKAIDKVGGSKEKHYFYAIIFFSNSLPNKFYTGPNWKHLQTTN